MYDNEYQAKEIGNQTRLKAFDPKFALTYYNFLLVILSRIDVLPLS